MKSHIVARKLTAFAKSVRTAMKPLSSSDGKLVFSVEPIEGPGVTLYRLLLTSTLAGAKRTLKYKRQLPDQAKLVSVAKRLIQSYENDASVLLDDFVAVASASVRKKASDTAPNWNTIVQRAADARLAFGYADACERAAMDDDEYNPDGPILDREPWGMGAEITNYVPSTPKDLVSDTEDSLIGAWGKDAVLADCKDFMAETGEDERTYGWYLATQSMGHGVGLSDYGYDTKLKRAYVFESDNASLQIENGKVLFYPIDSYDVKPIDVTDAVEHVLVDGVLDGEKPVEASVKSASRKKKASGAYTMTIKGGDPIDLAEVSAADVVSALEDADMSARSRHFGSGDITYTGNFGEVWLADWETAKGTYKEDTTPKTPLDAWCVAQLCTDKGGNTFGPVEVWVALDQRAGITTAAAATKFVKNAQSMGGFDGLSLNEGGGDPQHFHEYIGGEYGYLLDEGALSSKFSEEEIEAMDDAEKGKALLEYFFSDSTWYTDGFWMIETHPF